MSTMRRNTCRMTVVPSHIRERLAALPIEEVAQRLGMEVRCHKALCFMHDDQHPSMSFKPSENIWKCFVCGSGGKGSISLVKAYKGCDFLSACRWLGQTFNIWNDQMPVSDVREYVVPRPRMSRHQAKSQTQAYSFETYHRVMSWIINHAGLSAEAQRFLFEERRLKVDVVDHLHIGSVSDAQLLLKCLLQEFDETVLQQVGLLKKTGGRRSLHLWTPCLLLPYYDVHGQITCLQTRYLGDKKESPRFQFIGGSKGKVFNLPIVKTMSCGQTLYISEGVTDCMALLSAGHKAVAIPSATNLPSTALSLLKPYRLHMYPDNDQSGRKAFYCLRSNLIDIGSTLFMSNLPPEYKDFAEYYKSISLHE